MSGEYGQPEDDSLVITGEELYDPEALRLRGAYLEYLDALENPDLLYEVLDPEFWPHDMITDVPPPGVGRERLIEFRRNIISAASVKGTEVGWIDDPKVLSEIAGTDDLTGVVGAHIKLRYVHDRGVMSLPDGRSFSPTGKEVRIAVTDVVRFAEDPDIGPVAKERWSPASPMPSVIEQLQQNAASEPS